MRRCRMLVEVFRVTVFSYPCRTKRWYVACTRNESRDVTTALVSELPHSSAAELHVLQRFVALPGIDDGL